MKAFLKKNFLLMVGAVLPLVVIAFFILATRIPGTLTEQPQYSFLFTVSSYPPGLDRVVRVSVREGQLVAESRERTTDSVYRENVRLYYFDAAEQDVREIPLEPPLIDTAKPGVWQAFQISELANVRLDSSLTSPDGYHFDNSYRSSSGFIPELFIGNSYRHRLVLRKKGAIVKVIPNDNAFSPYNSRFIGWIRKE